MKVVFTRACNQQSPTLQFMGSSDLNSDTYKQTFTQARYKKNVIIHSCSFQTSMFFFYSVELKLACFHATKVNRKWGCQALKMRKRHNKNKLHSLPCVPYSETTWQLCEQMYYNTSLQYQIIIYNVHYLLHFLFFYILFWCIHKNK